MRRAETTNVHAEVFAVYPDARDVEYGAEPDELPFAFPAVGKLELAAINAGAATHAQIVKLRLPRCRHGDAPPLDRPVAVILYDVQKITGAVERDGIIVHQFGALWDGVRALVRTPGAHFGRGARQS